MAPTRSSTRIPAGRWAIAVALAIAAQAILLPAAHAADADACTARSIAPRERAAGCEAAIAAGNLSRRALARAWYNLGSARLSLGALPKAEEAFTRALRLTPGDVSALYNRAAVRERRRNYAGAVADLTLVLEREPRHAKALNNRGAAYHRLGKYKQALADYSAALALDSAKGIRWFNRGTAHYRLGRYGKAVDDYSEALKRDPSDRSALYARALAYEKLGLSGQAIADFRALLKAAPGHKGAARGLGRLGAK